MSENILLLIGGLIIGGFFAMGILLIADKDIRNANTYITSFMVILVVGIIAAIPFILQLIMET